VGQLDCSGDLLKFDVLGRRTAYNVAPDTDANWLGSAWIDLAADGCTALYASGGRNVKRFDVCRNAQLANFNTEPLPDPVAKVVRVLPDGGILLTNVSVIVRLDAAGRIVQTYNVPGESPAWGWLDLVGDGTFWVSNYYSSNIYRMDIATGQVLASFNASPTNFTIIGVAVKRGPGAQAAVGTLATPGAFAPGDVFLSLADGRVQWRLPDGTMNGILAGLMPGPAAGMAFDAGGNLYVTHLCQGRPYLAVCATGNGVEVFDPSGTRQGSFGSGYDCNPTSIRFDGTGRAYVGQLDCSGDILEFDSVVPTPQGAYDVAGEPDAHWQGSGWIDLAADGCTVLYTSGGRNIKRFDVCRNAQLADFNTTPLPDPVAKAFRILPDGGVLLANVSAITRLDAFGCVVQTYDVPGESPAWAWLDLVGDGTFWVVNEQSANVYRMDIATGQALTSFNAGVTSLTIIGVAVKPTT
jgi:outer membrane protein assembly factor BamB